MRILHVADTQLGARPYGLDRLEQDLRAGFERAVTAAIAHGVDVLLHAGGLLAPDARVDDHLLFVDAQLARLAGAGITPVLFDADGSLYGLDATMLHGGSSVEVGGTTFRGIGAGDVPQHPAGDSPAVVSVCHGGVTGLAGMGAHAGTIDPEALHETCRASGYVALGASGTVQSVEPNAWYSGPTAPVTLFQEQAGGLVVELGEATGRLLSLTRVRWPRRPHRQLVIDAGGMDAAHLALVLDEQLGALTGLAPASEPDPRILACFAHVEEVSGRGPQCRPVVRLEVWSPPCGLDDLRSGHPNIDWLLQHGEHLLLHVEWEGSTPTRFTPDHAGIPA